MLSYILAPILILIMSLSSMLMDPHGIGILPSIPVWILALLLNQAKTIFRALMYFLVLLILVVVFMLPCCSCAREAARRMQCTNQLKQITLALLNYEQEYKCFPPAFIADKDGKPMHSWRVLILPFLEHKDLYEQYDFNEPWDGPNNRKLLEKRPRGFACPSDEKAYKLNSTCTSYVAVVGADAAFEGPNPRKWEDLSRDASETIMLVETAENSIPWTAPVDFNVDALDGKATPSSKHSRSNGFFHQDTPSVVGVGIMDGSVRSLPAACMTGENMKKMFQIGGFHPDEPLSCEEEAAPIHWPNVAAFSVWLVASILLLVHAVRCRKRTTKL